MHFERLLEHHCTGRKAVVEVLSGATSARDWILGNLAGANGSATPASIMVFNGIGIHRRGVVRVASPPPGGPYRSITLNGQTFLPVQAEYDGSLLVQAEAPGFGYATMELSTNAPTEASRVSLSQSGNTVTMSNGELTAVVNGSGITSLSRAGGTNCLSGTGNQLQLFTDAGNIYRFGMEIPCYPATFAPQSHVAFVTGSVTTESGPLRATTFVNGTFNAFPFTIRYDLFAGDTALRISVTGAAPGSNVCVMTYFQFASAAASLTFGTTAHWESLAPRNYFTWKPPSPNVQMTFEATHDFVGVVDAGGALAGAIYHEATPAWGIYGDGILGCLLRNTPTTTNGQNAACASDTDTHTVTYVVSPPDGLVSPGAGARTEGSMLAAALQINNPLVALPVTGSGPLIGSTSIATPTDPRAIITAAKMGNVNPGLLVLRIYQPTNEPMNGVTVNISELFGPGLAPMAVNALEQPSAPLNISTNGNAVKLDLPFAITSLAM
jgi:alpha-mannosidase